MTALDLSAYVSTEPEDIKEFKKLVLETIKKYQSRYNWCGVAEQAVQKMNLRTETTKVTVRITLDFGAVLDVVVDPQELVGEDLEDQVSVLVGVANEIALVKSLNLTVSEGQVTNIELLERRPSGDVLDMTWMYVSDNGRVMHLISERDTYTYTLCGREYTFPTRYSSHGEGRRCERCLEEQRRLR